MSSDPNERARRRAYPGSSSGSIMAGLFGIALFATPVGGAYGSLTAAATGTPLSAFESPSAILLLIIAFLAIITLNGFFVAAEVSVELLRSVHVRIYEENSPEAKLLRELIDRKPLYVATSFLGAQTMRAWMVLLSLIPATALTHALGWVRPDGTSPMQIGALGATLLACLIVSFLVVGFSIVIGELVAKSYAAVHPQRSAIRLAKFIRFFSVVFALPSKVAMKIANIVTARFGAKASFAVANQAEEEIKEILESYEETGEIETEEREMLHSVFEFGDTVAREIMTPRVDLDAVPVETSMADVVRLVEETGHSRIPVYEGTDDTIVGILHAKDLLRCLSQGQHSVPISELMRPAMFVPENKDLHDLLQEMRNARAQMVVVQDEFGGTAGIVTIEDIVEEVVGEIVDEYDNETPSVVADASGFLVDGKLHLDDVNGAVGSSFESDEFDTIGGFLFGLFGRQAAPGESIDHQGYQLIVDSSDGRRIMTVRIRELDPSEIPDPLTAETTA